MLQFLFDTILRSSKILRAFCPICLQCDNKGDVSNKDQFSVVSMIVR